MSKDADGNVPGCFNSFLALGCLLIMGIVAYLFSRGGK